MTRYRLRTEPSQNYGGERRLPKAGRGQEFFELRGYSAGDELRFVDWRAYARTGRLYTRVFRQEAPARFRFFLDGSPSMALHGKAAYAERVFHMLASLSVSEGAFVFGGGRYNGKAIPIEQGPSILWQYPQKGTSVIITDALDPLDWLRLLQKLKQVVLVQILHPDELWPPFTNALLQDVETGQKLEVGPAETQAYRSELEKHLLRLRTYARRLGSYALLRVGEPWLQGLLRQGVLEER